MGRPPRMQETIAPRIDRDTTVRTPERVDREVDKRARDDFYDLPDFDNFDYQNFDPRKLALSAPPARIDERWGKMRQYWAAHNHNNGRRIQDLMEEGYRVRRPETVPSSFKGLTEKWEMHDVIMVAGEHMLMEIPESHLLKMQRVKHDRNNQLIMDIKQSHGKVTRIDNGEVQELRDNNASRFFKQQDVQRDNEGGNIAFDD